VDFLKKITCCFLLLIYLFSATAIVELFKLPQLVKHYQKHKAVNTDTNVISFLIMHYQKEDQAGNNSNADHQLPFKSHHHAMPFVFVALPAHLFFTILIKPGFKENALFKIPDHLQIPAKYLAVIWQPPRDC
jgi:hypothetical protein